MGYQEDADGHWVGPLSIGDAAEPTEADKLVQVGFYGLIFHGQLDLDCPSGNEGQANACLSIGIHNEGCTQDNDTRVNKRAINKGYIWVEKYLSD